MKFPPGSAHPDDKSRLQIGGGVSAPWIVSGTRRYDPAQVRYSLWPKKAYIVPEGTRGTRGTREPLLHHFRVRYPGGELQFKVQRPRVRPQILDRGAAEVVAACGVELRLWRPHMRQSKPRRIVGQWCPNWPTRSGRVPASLVDAKRTDDTMICMSCPPPVS